MASAHAEEARVYLRKTHKILENLSQEQPWQWFAVAGLQMLLAIVALLVLQIEQRSQSCEDTPHV